MPRSKREWHELELLCRSGVGLVSAAPSICRILRELVGADAASLFWLDEKGMPAGLFHESASQAALDLFVNEYDRLFVGPGEINVSQIAANRGNVAGFLLHPDPEYYKSNTLNLLVRPSGHYHTLDLRVDVDKQPRAVVMLFREEQRPFKEQDRLLIARAVPYLRVAFERGRPETVWERTDRRGHLLADQAGSRLLMIDDQARSLINACTVVGQDIRVGGDMSHPPRFIRDLCEQLASAPMAEIKLDLGVGRLQAVATPIWTLDAAGGSHVMISLEMLQAKPLAVVESLLEYTLSPLQRSIALEAALGGARSDSSAVTGVGKEALKKHLAVIYRTLGVNSWDELAKNLANIR